MRGYRLESIFPVMGISGWKRVLRETVRSFRRGLDGMDRRAPDARAMMREVAEAAERLERAEAERDRTRSAIRDERTAEASARRRATLARNAGDDETERIAGEFAARHARYAGVLEKKLDALEAECGWLADELRGMRRALELHRSDD